LKGAKAVPFIAALIMHKERARAAYYFIFYSALALVVNITKLTYEQARPFWVSTAVKAYKCETEFGNPSGHSVNAMGVALLIWLEYASIARHVDFKLGKWPF
jgi:membrane-associated phospholipid phosphatase